MPFVVAAAFTMRRKIILSSLLESGARSPETAKTLEEAGVMNPEKFPEYTEKLVLLDVIRKTEDGRYYLP
jgi:hypothetical protein